MRRRLLWLAVSLCMGLAFFVKGPVGVLVPCFVIACYLAIRREWSGFRLRGILLGAVVTLAVFVPYYAMLVYRLGMEVSVAGAASAGGAIAGADAGADLSSVLLAGVGRISELLRRETIERTLHGLDHPEPLHYYWVASLVIFFPWIAWIPSAIGRALPRLRRLEPATLFLVTWLVGVLLFFTAIRGKLVTYVLPAAPAIALLLGREWSRRRDEDPDLVDAPVDGAVRFESPSNRWITVGSIILVGATILLLGYTTVASPPWLGGHYMIADVLALGLALAASVPLLLRRPDVVCVSVAGVMTMSLIVVPVIVGRELGQNRSLAPLAHEAGFSERAWTRVLAYKIFRPSLVFYGGRDVTVLHNGRELHDALTPGCLVVLEQRHFDDLPPAWQSVLRTVATQGTVLAMTPVSMLPERDASGDAHGGSVPPVAGDPAP